MLIGHWPLTGNANDYSGFGRAGTETSVTYSTGKIGQAASFNGSTSRVTVSEVNLSSSWSASFWVNLITSSKSFEFILGSSNTSDNDKGRILIRRNNYVSYSYPENTYFAFSKLSDELVGGWNHLTFVAISGKVRLYINGVFNSEVTVTDPQLDVDLIGNGWSDNVWSTNGLINDVRLYDHSLSDYEIKEIAKAKIAHYKFTELASSSAYDVSGYKYGGTIVGTNYEISSSNQVKLGSASYWSKGNTNTYIYNTDIPEVSDQVSFSCWIYQTNKTATYSDNTTTTRQFVVSHGRDVTQYGMNIVVSDGEIQAWYGSSTTGNIILTSGVYAYTNGATTGWHHVLLTFSTSSGGKLYVDGALVDSDASNVINYTQASGAFVIGKMSYGYTGTTRYFPFYGYIDDVRVYATELTLDDATSMYKRRANLDNAGNFSTSEIVEPFNIGYSINQAIVDKTFSSGLSNYTQSNCQVTLTDDGLRIYRPPNLIYPTAGNTMWGGMRLYLPESAKTIGRSYRISFYIKGQTSNNAENYFSYEIGWSSYGIGLTSQSLSRRINLTNYDNSDYKKITLFYTVAANRYQNGTWGVSITDGSNVVYYNGQHPSALKVTVGDSLLSNAYFPSGTTVTASFSDRFEVSNNATGTATTTLQTSRQYDTYNQAKFGFSYTSTGALGTDLYIKDLTVVDVTDNGYTNVGNGGKLSYEEIDEYTGTEGSGSQVAQMYPYGVFFIDGEFSEVD